MIPDSLIIAPSSCIQKMKEQLQKGDFNFFLKHKAISPPHFKRLKRK